MKDIYIWEWETNKQKQIVSFRGLSSEEEARIRDILVPTYRYWGGGSITVTEAGASTLNVGVETSAPSSINIEHFGKILTEVFNVDCVNINDKVYNR